jgi:hypothetical protein
MVRGLDALYPRMMSVMANPANPACADVHTAWRTVTGLAVTLSSRVAAAAVQRTNDVTNK